MIDLTFSVDLPQGVGLLSGGGEVQMLVVLLLHQACTEVGEVLDDTTLLQDGALSPDVQVGDGLVLHCCN